MLVHSSETSWEVYFAIILYVYEFRLIKSHTAAAMETNHLKDAILEQNFCLPLFKVHGYHHPL